MRLRNARGEGAGRGWAPPRTVGRTIDRHSGRRHDDPSSPGTGRRPGLPPGGSRANFVQGSIVYAPPTFESSGGPPPSLRWGRAARGRVALRTKNRDPSRVAARARRSFPGRLKGFLAPGRASASGGVAGERPPAVASPPGGYRRPSPV